jgi:LAO/AO transport system kinase
MERLSVLPQAFIRPSPAAGNLGGVAEKTREAILLCEAAGFDIVVVETVGVGQSEIAVASMTDLFVLLQLPNAGDDLQAIKKGVMESADVVVVNKADIDADAATRALAQLTSTVRLLGLSARTSADPESHGPKVLALSALKDQGLDAFWSVVQSTVEARKRSGAFAVRRQGQARAWMWDLVHAQLHQAFHAHPNIRSALPGTLAGVDAAQEAPSAAARRLMQLFFTPRN